MMQRALIAVELGLDENIIHFENDLVKLVEAGFEYVTDIDECKLFRKRK